MFEVRTGVMNVLHISKELGVAPEVLKYGMAVTVNNEGKVVPPIKGKGPIFFVWSHPERPSVKESNTVDLIMGDMLIETNNFDPATASMLVSGTAVTVDNQGRLIPADTAAGDYVVGTVVKFNGTTVEVKI